MEKRIYWTRIKGAHKTFGKNTYVNGVIAGISNVICGDCRYPHLHNGKTGDFIINAVCTPSDYQVFTDRVSKKYPDLCEFDYEVDVKKLFKKEES